MYTNNPVKRSHHITISSLTSAYGNPRSAFSSYFVRSPYYAKPGHAEVQSVSQEIGSSLKISRFPQIIYVFCNSNENLRAEIAEIVSAGEKEEKRRKEESVSRGAGRVCQARHYTALHNAAAIR